MGTHDFIQFPPPAVDLDPRTWLLLGDIQARIQSLGFSPMPPEDAYELNSIYLAKAIHGTTAIEGNRLSEDQVSRLIQGDALPASVDQLQLKQIDSMVAAYTAVALDSVSDEPPLFSLELLNRYHALILDGLETDEAPAGQLRMHNVTVGRYLAPPADDCEFMLAQFCAWLNTEGLAPEEFEWHELAFEIMKAIMAHVYFALIHPYADGNGRMARLIEHALLLRAGVPASAAHVFSYCYSQSRERYYQELQDTHGDFIDGAYHELELGEFVHYALDHALEELVSQINWIATAQTQALWRELIRAHFPLQLTVAQQRRLRLAIDLTDRFAGVPQSMRDIWHLLDYIPAGAFEYSMNMLDLDLSALVKLGVLTQDGHGFQTNLEIMQSMFGNRGITPN